MFHNGFGKLHEDLDAFYECFMFAFNIIDQKKEFACGDVMFGGRERETTQSSQLLLSLKSTGQRGRMIIVSPLMCDQNRERTKFTN